ncbi:MAG: TIGR00153 family protein [Endozoicomonadaceae bacterium]|nr:TIGR00153 family protein [Endozoicomonadaceae bacterium]
MPSINLFASVFGRSPIGSIQKHISLVHDCVSELQPFFKATLKQEWEQAEHYQLLIVDLEEQADQIKKQIRLSLPKSLFLPVPRTDLLGIVTVQDKVANRAKDIAGLILGRQMSFPEELHEALGHYLDRSIQTSAQALKAMNELDELLETGFRGRETDIVEEMIKELNDLESETDDLQIQIRRVLFTLETRFPPVDVMFMYKIIEWIGDLADRASRVGSYLQLLLAK